MEQPTGGSAASASPDSAPFEEPEADAAQAPSSLTAEQFPELSSRDCAVVAAFYTQAITAGDFGRAALVWNDPIIDAAALKRLFESISAPRFTLQPPRVEGAAGSLYCTVPGTLADAQGAGTVLDGELMLRRVNDVDGATARQLRWTIRSSTLPPMAEMP